MLRYHIHRYIARCIAIMLAHLPWFAQYIQIQCFSLNCSVLRSGCTLAHSSVLVSVKWDTVLGLTLCGPRFSDSILAPISKKMLRRSHPSFDLRTFLKRSCDSEKINLHTKKHVYANPSVINHKLSWNCAQLNLRPKNALTQSN